jgi:hypothetical protein
MYSTCLSIKYNIRITVSEILYTPDISLLDLYTLNIKTHVISSILRKTVSKYLDTVNLTTPIISRTVNPNVLLPTS